MASADARKRAQRTRSHLLSACFTRLRHTRTSRITSSALLLLIVLIALLIARPAAGQTVRGEEYEAQTYHTTSYSVRSGESPEAVCAKHSFAYGWNDPPYSKQVSQIAPGRWVCQLYYEGRVYPGMAVQIVGGCQAEPVVPLGQLAGRYVDFPYWDDQKAVCYCGSSNHSFNRDIQWCEAGSWSRKPEPSEPIPSRGHMCPAGRAAGNPILLGTAEKSHVDVDFADAGASGLSFARTYRSAYRSSWRQPAGARAMGKAWTHSHQTYLRQFGNTVTIDTAEGDPRTFIQPGGATTWQADTGPDTLVHGPSDWTWRRSSDDSTWQFNSAGKPVSVTQRNGWTTTYAYNPVGQLTQIQGPLNRTLSLAYNTAGQLITMTTPDGRSVGYEYDTIGRLSLVRQGDNTTRSYLYENAAFPEALTGIVDEAGTRYATYGYDSLGRASTTEHAGGTGRYQVSYPNNPGNSPATVVDPLGTTRTFSYTTTQGKRTITSGSLPSGVGESDAASRVPDANGLTTSETDFKGVVTTTTWDVARRLPVSVTRASGTPETQTVTTQWHPTFALPVLVTEAGRTTTYTHDDRGNLLSQAITDTASSPNTTRTWQWTWNAQGLAATETDPNGAVTSFEYDPRGNLVKSTNALGHVTQHGFDSANRLIGTIDPAGLSTTYTWDARDRLLSKTVTGQGTTTLSYTATGLLDTLTLPSGLVVSYSYDAAHRLTGWRNNRGESGSYRPVYPCRSHGMGRRPESIWACQCKSSDLNGKNAYCPFDDHAGSVVAESVAFRYRTIESAMGVTRATVRRLAEHLGVDETQATHQALHNLAARVLPQYEADDGPLIRAQVRQIKKQVPLGAKRSVRSSLFDT